MDSPTDRTAYRFADALLMARRAAGLDQEELGAKVGVSRQTISAWENAHNRPSSNHLAKLERELRVGPGQLSALLDDDTPDDQDAAEPADTSERDWRQQLPAEVSPETREIIDRLIRMDAKQRAEAND